MKPPIFSTFHQVLKRFITRNSLKSFDKWKFKKIEDVSNFTQDDIQKGVLPIRQKMYQAEHIADFCAQNQILSPEQKSVIHAWEMAYTDDFYIIKYLKNMSC